MSGRGGQPCVACGHSGSTVLSLTCERVACRHGTTVVLSLAKSCGILGERRQGHRESCLVHARVVSLHHETRRMSYYRDLKALEHLVADQPKVGAL